MKALLILALWLLAAGAAQAQTTGVNAGGLRGLDPAVQHRHLGLLAASGVQLVRFDASWDAPPPDAAVAALAAHRLRWAPIICYNRGPDPFTAPDEREYAAYARSLVERYGHGGSFWREHPDLPYMPVRVWEVWNEPNIATFWHPVDAGRYGRLFVATSAAIRAADGRAKVMTAGLLGDTAPRYLRAVLAAGGRPDLVGFHPYYRRVRDLRASIERIRRVTDTPIALTEVGWTGAGPGYWTRLMVGLSRWRLGVVQVMPYAWIEPTWGLATPAGPTAAGWAYLTSASRAAVKRSTSR